jgi:hypothetical protein
VEPTEPLGFALTSTNVGETSLDSSTPTNSACDAINIIWQDFTDDLMAVEEKEVEGIEGLLREALALAKTQPNGGFLWYRGLNRASYKLLPKIMRDNKSIEQVLDRERRLLTRFRQRSLAYWPAGYPQTDWEHLFAMQHYGMPTRLLDWSENLFVAAHFALAVAPSEVGPPECPAVWCVNPIDWNRATPVLSEYGDTIQILTTTDDEIEAYRPTTSRKRNKSPVALFGTHNSGRIVAQRGTFMIWGNDTRELEAFAGETPGKLWKLVIQGDRTDLARDLSNLGFGETMVFPELSSLAVELSRVEGWR